MQYHILRFIVIFQRDIAVELKLKIKLGSETFNQRAKLITIKDKT